MKKKKRNKSYKNYIIPIILSIIILGSIGVFAELYLSNDNSRNINYGNVTFNNSGIVGQSGRLFIRGFDKVVCDYNITTYQDDIKMCDYVCSIDGDCSDEINLCINESTNNCLLLGNNFSISNTINMRSYFTLQGSTGTGYSISLPTKGTFLNWNGNVGGVMINASGLTNYEITKIHITGNFIAGTGIKTGYNARGKRVIFSYLHFDSINGTSIDFGHNVDDTMLLEITCRNGGADSICLKNYVSMVNVYHSLIGAQQRAGVYWDGDFGAATPSGNSINFFGTLFSNNYDNIMLNCSGCSGASGHYFIGMDNVWSEGVGRSFIRSIGTNSEIWGINANNLWLGYPNTTDFFYFNNSRHKTYLNFYGGWVYNPSIRQMNLNENVSVSFINMRNSEDLNITGTTDILRIDRNTIDSASLRKVSDQGLVLDLNLNNNTLYYNGSNYIIYDSSQYSNNAYIKSLNYMNNTCVNEFCGFFNHTNSVNSYIVIPKTETLNFSGNMPLTISLWVYPRTRQSGDSMFADDDELTLQFDGSLRAQFVLNSFTTNDRAITSKAPLNNTWYHIVGSYDGTTIKAYVNGELQGTSKPTGSYAYSSAQYQIGYDGSQSPWDGYIDNIQVYNRALTDNEIKYLFSIRNPEINTNIKQFFSISITNVLPLCNSLKDGTIARNSTKLYFCNSTDWNALY